jgi:hypothetical protein
MHPDLQIDGTEVMWLEIKIKVGIILLNIIYRSPTEAGSLFWNSYSKIISDALDCSSKIISLGDHNVDFLRPLPKKVNDIIHVYGLENKISDPTRFGHNSSSLLDPILVTDSITELEANTIPFDCSISDHDPTYIVVNCGYKNSKSYTWTVWLYNQGNYALFRYLIPTLIGNLLFRNNQL